MGLNQRRSKPIDEYLLRARSHNTEAIVIFTNEDIESTGDLLLEDLSSQIDLIGGGTAEPDTVNRLQRPDHTRRRAQPARNIRLGLLQLRHDHLGELQEIRLPPPRRLLLVLEPEYLVRAARQLDPVEASALELRAQVATVLGREPSVLELDAVELDAQAERSVRHAPPDLLRDLDDDPSPVDNRLAAVLVRPLVRRRRQELSEQVPVRAVQLDAIVASAVGVLRRVSEPTDNGIEVGLLHGSRLRERTESVVLELHVTSRDGVVIDPRVDLPSRVRHLHHDETTVGLGRRREVAEPLEPQSRERRVARDDRVPCRL